MDDDKTWVEKWCEWGITRERHIKTVTEGALLVSIVSHGIHRDLVVVSNDNTP